MPSLLDVLGSDPNPALIWHGQGERIELSHRVLRNWLIKGGNFLYSEAGLDAGDTLVVDLPAHWRSVVWAGAGGVIGVQVQWPQPGGPELAADATVTTDPHAVGDTVIVTPLASLARSFEGQLPPGVHDGAAELMGQPDAPLFTAFPLPPAPTDPASGDQGAVLPRGNRTGGSAETHRFQIVTEIDPATAVTATLGALARGRSVLMITDPEADPNRVMASEGLAGD